MLTLSFLCFSVVVSAEVYFKEEFGSDWEDRWVQSKSKSDYGKFVHTAGKFFADEEKSKGIQTSQDAKFYAIGAKFPSKITNAGKTLVVQFEVKHEQNIDCGGGYLKLLSSSVDLTDFHGGEGETPYSIMFGPDICGYTKKVHLIFNYKGKNLLWKKEPRIEGDTLTHLYTLILNAVDQSYEVHIDGEKKESGKLVDDWDFLAPNEIDDPSDHKPSDWIDEPEIDDPADTKPDDWDSQPETIPDPDASKPEDWDTEEDGEWEAPTIPNPKFKGAWKPKRIANPAYKGVWKAKQIANPDYVADDQLAVYSDIGAVGIDVWQVKSGTIFDDIFVSDSVKEAEAFASETFKAMKAKEEKAKEAADAASKPAESKGDDSAGAEEEDEEDL